MSDSIHIHQLEVPALIGAYDEERAAKQKLLVTLEFKVESIQPAAFSDELRSTIDYTAVCETIKKIAAERHRKLVETLAEEMAEAVLENYPIEEVILEIEKLALPDARSVSVKITRRAGGKK